MGDFSAVAGEVTENFPVIDFFTVHPGTGEVGRFAVPVYRRIGVVGIAGNMVLGSWLFKGEYAYKSRFPFQTSDAVQQATSGVENPVVATRRDRQTALVGLEYGGINNWIFIVEYLRHRISGWDTTVDDPRWDGGIYAYARWSALRETLLTEFFFIHNAGDNGDTFSVKSDYDLNDNWCIGGGFTLFETDNPAATIYSWRKADKVNVRVTWRF